MGKSIGRIERLKRIHYLICKDGLDAAWQHTTWGVFETSFLVISSYSESVSHFSELGRSFATQYGGIQILANACAPRARIGNNGESIEVGNVMIPCACCANMQADIKTERYEIQEYCWQTCFKKQKI